MRPWSLFRARPEPESGHFSLNYWVVSNYSLGTTNCVLLNESTRMGCTVFTCHLIIGTSPHWYSRKLHESILHTDVYGRKRSVWYTSVILQLKYHRRVNTVQHKPLPHRTFVPLLLWVGCSPLTRSKSYIPNWIFRTDIANRYLSYSYLHTRQIKL